ncbi:hypothetical protein KIN20_004822 [Parelaphostrongylus tenuis]|uniref:Uncharacterized protein n=1 Tax=Parelaphostrongylus tenuis TaxID=148309 RepID=A0AAD5M3P4_PARTN|nr:hypothetical protein KIN20_004822 [Parelaphostrongylus tenuis]
MTMSSARGRCDRNFRLTHMPLSFQSSDFIFNCSAAVTTFEVIVSPCRTRLPMGMPNSTGDSGGLITYGAMDTTNCQ